MGGRLRNRDLPTHSLCLRDRHHASILDGSRAG
jgi:hypothetical protein